MTTQPDQRETAPEATYNQRCELFAERRDHYNRLSYRNANLSLGLIVAAMACLGMWLWSGAAPWIYSAALLGLAFLISFLHHGRVDRQHRRYAELWTINDEGLRRLRRDWKALPLRYPQPADPEHPFAADLDLLGRASLYHLLGTPATPVGAATLRRWLLDPAAPSVVRRRQAAVGELAPLLDLRDELALRGRLMGPVQSDYEQLLRWAESEPWLARRRWLLWLARLMPLLMLGTLVLQLSGTVALPLGAGLLLASLALTFTIGRKVDELIDRVAERQEVFHTYADLFHLITAQPSAAPELRRLQADLSAGGLSAARQIRRLARLMPLADLRRWMFFLPIQLVTLWNVHLLWLLEHWQQVAGKQARGWLMALGETEALAALAALAHDHPGWAFPDLTEDQPAVLSALGLGHPLLAPAVCVGNDVEVGPAGTLLLVTGSNMSGKSTLLRAIGVNVVLAQAGGPVCASSLRLPPIALATSMRVQDSLAQGVSHFMAELKRLRLVVDLMQAARATGERMPLFLLDEILHGTNTAERQIAARQIIRHLLDLGATGAVSTHDLALADAPETAAGRLVHFTETITPGAEGLTMSFDYRLRPGIATSTNALALVHQVLGEVLPAAEGPAPALQSAIPAPQAG